MANNGAADDVDNVVVVSLPTACGKWKVAGGRQWQQGGSGDRHWPAATAATESRGLLVVEGDYFKEKKK